MPYVTPLSLKTLSLPFPSKQDVSPRRDAPLHSIYGSESAWDGVKMLPVKHGLYTTLSSASGL